ncbi:dethiobiotin synthase [Pedobacter sp. MR22-3]|uniref:dethiobiotin synthase n=1 Tax=Pedobacter sp. MR22-3 TaxID=2994552 RepID=UPI0022460314|nr:dethiobiotin synthase [Pedobacter sp. MR22-3]MCX2586042.1 dethiobiotin synthase [Pedobacter sp. MR22-3]
MKLFITGIGTEVGKTICAAILTKYFNATYWKPIQSGDLDHTDSMKIKAWAGEYVIINPEKYLLKLAASPHQSAAKEGISIHTNDFVLPENSERLIIEGAGGLMVPISDHEFMIDLIVKLDLPAALVVKNYLGCINHSLLSIMAINQRKIKLQYLILNGSFPEATERVICNFTGAETKIIKIPHIKKISEQSIESISKKIENL